MPKPEEKAPPESGPLPAAPYMEKLRSIVSNPMTHERTKFEEIERLLAKYDSDLKGPPEGGGPL